MTTDDALKRELERTLGSSELAKRVYDDIVRLRDGVGGSQLAEMARDLLDGRIDVRAVARSSAYAEPLSAAAARYDEWLQSLDPEERDRLMAEARTLLAGSDDETP
jgi:hypothetical protein